MMGYRAFLQRFSTLPKTRPQRLAKLFLHANIFQMSGTATFPVREVSSWSCVSFFSLFYRDTGPFSFLKQLLYTATHPHPIYAGLCMKEDTVKKLTREVIYAMTVKDDIEVKRIRS